MKIKSALLIILILLSASSARSASILLPERYDIEVQLDSFMEELMKKVQKKDKVKLYIADLNSPSKSLYYQVLNENIKSYITGMASITKNLNPVSSKAADEKINKLKEEKAGKPITDYQLLEQFDDSFCDYIIYGYISILDEKLVVDLKTLDLKNKRSLFSMYVSSNEQTIAAKVGIKDYTPSSFLRHSIGLSFDTTFTSLLLGDAYYELYTVYLNYSYYFFKWGALNAQLGFDINSNVTNYNSTTSGGVINSANYIYRFDYTGANFDLNIYWNFFIPFNNIIIPIISVGVGGSKHTKRFYYQSWSSGIPFETILEPFLFNILATAGFDIYFNKNLYFRATADLKYTVNPFEYTYNSIKYIYQKPLFSVTLGFFYRL